MVDVEFPKIIYNAIRTPDGTILNSRSRHDYQAHTDKNGLVYTNDGGLDYFHRTIQDIPYEDLSVFSNDSHDKIREVLVWGSYGKRPTSFSEPTWILLKNLSNDHINAILTTMNHISELKKDVFRDELAWRIVNNIYVEDSYG